MSEFSQYLYGIIYGLIQGLSEFLPVSSSGHLALFPLVAEFKDPGIVFDLAMHVGTALAVALYFYKDLLKITSSLYEWIFKKGTDFYGVNFVVATFFSGVLGFLIKDFAALYGRSPFLIAFNLSFFGVLLFLADKYSRVKNYSLNLKNGLFPAALIGLSQVLAIFPGVSRSGITITSARFMGLSRHEASSFSFLLSFPLIIAGAILKLFEMKKSEGDFSLIMCLIGMLVSFVTGLVTIHYFLKLIKKIQFSYFMIYRIIIAVLVLIFVS